MNTVPPSTPKPAAAPSGTDHDALPPGTRFGEFEILRVLGVGGFGIVYLANDHSLEREVALKEYMPASLAARGQGPQITVRSSSFAETYAIGLRSFVNEARLLARFDHPSLVKVYRFWEDNATAYMVMPFLQGVTLRDTRRSMAHPPDEAWIRSVITPILSALELLHKEGVYHRDIAPDNILLPPDGPPVLLDFGAARRVISDRTQSLTAILKPSYAPIEQYAEMTQLRQGPWTDLYALGAVIHYLLFGAPPAPATARAVQDDGDTIENRIVPGVSPLFLEAVSWMLSIRPNQRPQSGEQLRAVLDGQARIPPRGRPGITLPGAMAPAAPPAAFTAAPAFEPTRHVDHVADPSQVQTAHMPTFLPTAQVSPPGTPRPSTFSPTSQMPTARVPPSQFDPASIPPVARTAPPPVAPAAALPTAARTAPPVTRPAPLPPPPSRPAPLSASASRQVPLARASQAAAATASPPSSKTGLVIGAGLLFVAIAALAGWQIMSRRGTADAGAVDAAASAAAVVPSVVAAPPTLPAVVPAVVPAAVPVAAPVSVPATAPALPAAVATAPAAASATARTTPANGLPVPAVVADPSRSGSVAAVRPAPTSAVDGRPLSTDRAAADRSALANPAASMAASGARPRVAGRPVPANDGALPGAPVGSPYGTPSYGNPTAAVPTYGSGGTASPNPSATDRSRPFGPSARDPAPVQRPAPVAQADAGAPASAREACGKRVFIALAVCMDEKCEEPRFRNTQECIGILARKTTRENR